MGSVAKICFVQLTGPTVDIRRDRR
jgi:hypothetical protein